MDQISTSEGQMSPAAKTGKTAKLTKGALKSGAFDAIFAGMAVKSKGPEGALKMAESESQEGLSPELMAHLSAPKIKAKLLPTKTEEPALVEAEAESETEVETMPELATEELQAPTVVPLIAMDQEQTVEDLPSANVATEDVQINATAKTQVTALNISVEAPDELVQAPLATVDETAPKVQETSSAPNKPLTVPAAPILESKAAKPEQVQTEELPKLAAPIVEQRPQTNSEVRPHIAAAQAPTMVVSELRSARAQKLDMGRPSVDDAIAAPITEGPERQSKPKARATEPFSITAARVAPTVQQPIAQTFVAPEIERSLTGSFTPETTATNVASANTAELQRFDNETTQRADKRDLPVLDTRAEDWLETLTEMVDGVRQDGAQEIELALTPDNLGDLKIRIEVDDAGAQITIVTENSEASKLFNQNENQLAELLQQRGLSLGQHAAGERRDQQQAPQQARNAGAEADKAPEQSAVNQLETRHDGRLNIVA